MHRAIAVLLLVGFAASPLAAQGRGGRNGNRSQGIPPGHLPPPGTCRVWYEGTPPGHQPPPTSCREAERVAAGDRYARVIYGGNRGGRNNDGWWEQDGRGRGRAIPRRNPSQYPDQYPYPDSRYPSQDRFPIGRDGRYGSSVPFDNGYKDGIDKGQEDARDNDAYDPQRHSRYKSGDHGYDRRYGSKDEYRSVYREGFRAGYDDGYRGIDPYDPDRRRSGSRLPWPF